MRPRRRLTGVLGKLSIFYNPVKFRYWLWDQVRHRLLDDAEEAAPVTLND